MSADLRRRREQGDVDFDERLSPGLSLRWLLGGIFAVALLLSALTAWFLVFAREDHRARSLQNTALHARLLTDLVDRSFETVQVSLRSVSEGLDPVGVWEGDSHRLMQAVHSLPFLRSLHVVDGEGRVLASSNSEALGQRVPVALLGSPPTGGQWRVPAVLAGRDLLDARPLGQTPAKRLVVPVVMGLGSADDPAGVNPRGVRMVAVVNPEHFATQFGLLLKETSLQAVLLQLDMRVLATTEAPDLPLGVVPATTVALRERLNTKPFDERLAAGLDGQEALTAYRNSRLAPWVVVVEEPLSAVDAGMRTLLLQTLSAWLLAMGVLTGVTWFGLHSVRAYAQQRDARLAARRDLQRQHVLTVNLIDASATALYAKDQQGRVLMANQAWTRLASTAAPGAEGDASQALHRDADPSSPEHPDAELWARGGMVTFEARVATPGGERDMLVNKVAVRDEAGEVVALVGSLTDVSVYREAERRSREAAQAAQEASQAKAEFMANMSHELRTPLQSILGFSELGMVRCTESPAAVAHFQRVNDAGKHMLSLVNDLLTLTQPEVNSLPMALEVCPLAPLVAPVLAELAAQAAGKQVVLHGLTGDEPAQALVERRGFQQVVRNLVANSIRFAPPGSDVELSLANEGDQVVLRVSDRGPGIPPEELETIFAPFVQSSVTKTQAGGTGLGLAICRRFVSAFGGRIWAENRPGGGAVMLVALPQSQPAPSVLSEARGESPPAAPAG